MRTINEKKLIFCMDCRWLVRDESTDNVLEDTDYDCRYPVNVTVNNSWLCSEEVYMKKPCDLNKKNDCGWFASKFREK